MHCRLLSGSGRCSRPRSRPAPQLILPYRLELRTLLSLSRSRISSGCWRRPASRQVSSSIWIPWEQQLVGIGFVSASELAAKSRIRRGVVGSSRSGDWFRPHVDSSGRRPQNSDGYSYLDQVRLFAFRVEYTD
jgi:hypothetical protein